MTKDNKAIFGSHHGLDDRSVDSLVKALERENLPGFDYLEFKQALYALQQLNMDEATAFRSAFATAATMGLTKEKLLKTADHYKNVLAKEKQSFDQAMQNQIVQRVDGKRKEVILLQKRIEEYQAKIQQLNTEIEKAERTIADADATIEAARASIEDVKEKFELTYFSITKQIDLDIEDIQQYL
jgi:chromosome segregation ATPase